MRTIRMRQIRTLLFAVLFASLLSGMPASAKTKTSSGYKKAYSDFLAKGSFSYTYTVRRSTAYGTWYTGKTTYHVKINRFALVNIDGKGQPELLFLSKQCPAAKKTDFNYNVYAIYIARMKNGKVQVLPFAESKVEKGTSSDQTYTNKGWGLGYADYYSYNQSTHTSSDLGFNLSDGGGIWYDSAHKALVAGDHWKHSPKGEGFTDYYFYKLNGAKISYKGTQILTYSNNTVTTSTPNGKTAPSYIRNFKAGSAKTVKQYTNSKANRKKLLKGKIKPVK